MLIMTEQAAETIRGILADANAGPDGGLRISGETHGNGEAALEFAVAERPLEGDEVVQDGGALIFLDGVAAEVLSDKTLDVEAHGDHFHFSLGEQDEVL